MRSAASASPPGARRSDAVAGAAERTNRGDSVVGNTEAIVPPGRAGWCFGGFIGHWQSVLASGDFGAAVLGDFDGDGNLDFAIASAIYLGDGTGGVPGTWALRFGLLIHMVVSSAFIDLPVMTGEHERRGMTVSYYPAV
ncbi:MAG TPA: hypothetical protein VI386_04525 [Candidatus Sulfotelmatobacter sp.]